MIPKTCCRALAVAFALSLLSPALVADTYWRWTSDGGTSWTSVDSLPRRHGARLGQDQGHEKTNPSIVDLPYV